MYGTAGLALAAVGAALILAVLVLLVYLVVHVSRLERLMTRATELAHSAKNAAAVRVTRAARAAMTLATETPQTGSVGPNAYRGQYLGEPVVMMVPPTTTRDLEAPVASRSLVTPLPAAAATAALMTHTRPATRPTREQRRQEAGVSPSASTVPPPPSRRQGHGAPMGAVARRAKRRRAQVEAQKLSGSLPVAGNDLGATRRRGSGASSSSSSSSSSSPEPPDLLDSQAMYGRGSDRGLPPGDAI